MIKTSILINLIGYVIGSLGGLAYFYLFPCETGCAIRSNVLFNILMGAMIGDLIFQFVKRIVTTKN